MRVAFLLQDLQLSGGVGVVVEHAGGLRRRHGFECDIVLTRPPERPPWPYRGLDDVPTLTLDEACAREYDVAVATWWETTAVLFQVPARRHVYFLQLLEDSTYPAGEPERLAAAMTTALPVRFVTEAHWIAAIVERLQPGARALYVRNGIAKEVFGPVASVAPAPAAEPLRVVIEGARGYVHKGVDDALAAAALMRERRVVTWVSPHPADPPPGVDRVLCGLPQAAMADLLAEQHVMLKLSRAEGMYGPPLEAFHRGATVVTTPVSGHDEYVEHGVNGLIVGWDDPHGTARALDLLARDRRLLHELRCGALRTARAWPSWAQSTNWMALALARVLAEPPPRADGAGLRMASDALSALAEAQRTRKHVEIERAVLGQFKAQRAWQLALAVRRRVEPLRRLAARARALAAWRRR